MLSAGHTNPMLTFEWNKWNDWSEDGSNGIEMDVNPVY